MLEIHQEGIELFDEATMTFKNAPDLHLKLEHSLLAVSKWEQKFKVPFMEGTEKSREATNYYIECMVVEGPDHPIAELLSAESIQKIQDYVLDSASATTIRELPGQKRKFGSRELVTSELIYYWMTAARIPFEAENWHINRLFQLIKICSIKNGDQKDKTASVKSRQEQAQMYREINERNKKLYGTSG